MALSVEALLISGRLGRIAPDRNAALVRIAKAEQHLATAQMLLGHDNEVAYTALYDAARKALTVCTARTFLPIHGSVRTTDHCGPSLLSR